MRTKIKAYTDGSAINTKPYYGGFGVLISEENCPFRALSLGFINTTVGRMEIMAVLYLLDSMPKDEDIDLIIYSDSQYVVNSFEAGWLKKWSKNGWKNTSGDVKNQDLWKRILSIVSDKKRLKFQLVHQKGHVYDKAKKADKKELLKDHKIFGNKIADGLADYKRHETYKEDLTEEQFKNR